MPIPSQKKKEVYFLFFNIFKAVFNVEVKNLMTKLEVVFVLESIYYFAKCIFDCRQCYCYRFRDDVFFSFFFFFFCLKERKKLLANSFLDHLILLRLYFYNSVTNSTYFWRAKIGWDNFLRLFFLYA